MQLDYVSIGSVPYDENCAQVGSEGYYDLMKLETAAFIKAIIQKCGEPPDGASLVVKDGEVICRFPYDNAPAAAYAYKCENDAPQTWAEVGMTAPRIDDPEFTRTELIPVPPKPYLMWQGDIPTICDMSHDPIANCQEKIFNEFFDCKTKQGPWGNLCPKCFGRWGVGIGTGMGQRFKKAVDGNFFKVEG